MYFVICFLRPCWRFRSPSWTSALQLSSPLCPGWFCTHVATLGKPFHFFFPPWWGLWVLLHYQGGANLAVLFFFSASSVFPFKESHLVDSQSFSQKQHVAQCPIRGGELKGKRERQGRRDGGNSLAFPAYQFLIFFPWDLFQVSLCLSFHFVLKEVIWWIELLMATFWFLLLLSEFNCRELCSSLGGRWSVKHLPGLCQESCSALGFFNAYVYGSELKHLAASSAVASHFSEARNCVNRVLFFAWASRKWLLK